MTDVVQYEAPRQSDPTGGRLVAWASSLTAAKAIGSALCQTSFVPTTFRGKPEEAAADGDCVDFAAQLLLQPGDGLVIQAAMRAIGPFNQDHPAG